MTRKKKQKQQQRQRQRHQQRQRQQHQQQQQPRPKRSLTAFTQKYFPRNPKDQERKDFYFPSNKKKGNQIQEESKTDERR